MWVKKSSLSLLFDGIRWGNPYKHKLLGKSCQNLLGQLPKISCTDSLMDPELKSNQGGNAEENKEQVNVLHR